MDKSIRDKKWSQWPIHNLNEGFSTKYMAESLFLISISFDTNPIYSSVILALKREAFNYRFQYDGQDIFNLHLQRLSSRMSV